MYLFCERRAKANLTKCWEKSFFALNCRQAEPAGCGEVISSVQLLVWSTHSSRRTRVRWLWQRETAAPYRCWSEPTAEPSPNPHHRNLYQPQLKRGKKDYIKLTRVLTITKEKNGVMDGNISDKMCVNDSHSLASSDTSFAVSRVRGPRCLRDRARIGRIPLTTTCSAAPLSGHK